MLPPLQQCSYHIVYEVHAIHGPTLEMYDCSIYHVIHTYILYDIVLISYHTFEVNMRAHGYLRVMYGDPESQHASLSVHDT